MTPINYLNDDRVAEIKKAYDLIKSLESALKSAIEREDYELAAKLRDELKEREAVNHSSTADCGAYKGIN